MNRQQLLKLSVKYASLLMTGVSSISLNARAGKTDSTSARSKPNIIVMMGDDDLRPGCAFHSVLGTGKKRAHRLEPAAIYPETETGLTSF